MIFSFQVPFYLGELTEKVAHDDRIHLLKVCQAKLKVNTVRCLNHILMIALHQGIYAHVNQNPHVLAVCYKLFLCFNYDLLRGKFC